MNKNLHTDNNNLDKEENSDTDKFLDKAKLGHRKICKN